MNDLIKRAVELADGWQWRGDTWYGPMLICDTKTETLLEDKWGFLLDALAAQLVRQVDASRKWHLTIADNFTDLRDDGTLQKGCRIESSNRTMNTIKAIVDSKVLENQ